MFLLFLTCLLLAFGPLVMLYRLGLSEYGTTAAVVWGLIAHVVTQLVKMLFVATFVPETDDSAVVFVFRTLASSADVLGVFLGLRMTRVSMPKAKVVAFALGWVAGESLLLRVLAAWTAWGAEFEWSFVCTALDTAPSLVFAAILVAYVEMWSASRRKKGEPQSVTASLFLRAAAVSMFLPIVTQTLDKLGAWPGLITRAALAVGAFVYGPEVIRL